MEDKAIYVCLKAGGLSSEIKGSRLENCHDCLEMIWVAPSADSVKAPFESITVCQYCYLERTKKLSFKFRGLTPEQTRELIENGAEEDG